MSEVWKPNVTVAAIIERDGKFLMVEENTVAGLRMNQPAGHWEQNETLKEAVAREALEETAHQVVPEALLGVYTTHNPASDTTYLRFAYVCRITGHDPGRALDKDIVRAVWLTPEEIAASPTLPRSPLVLRCVQDYLAGQRYPLELVTHS
jgi:ADP-ribose pyrophosphatase YjhB (NUDIX family)